MFRISWGFGTRSRAGRPSRVLFFYIHEGVAGAIGALSRSAWDKCPISDVAAVTGPGAAG